VAWFRPWDFGDSSGRCLDVGHESVVSGSSVPQISPVTTDRWLMTQCLRLGGEGFINGRCHLKSGHRLLAAGVVCICS